MEGKRKKICVLIIKHKEWIQIHRWMERKVIVNIFCYKRVRELWFCQGRRLSGWNNPRGVRVIWRSWCGWRMIGLALLGWRRIIWRSRCRCIWSPLWVLSRRVIGRSCRWCVNRVQCTFCHTVIIRCKRTVRLKPITCTWATPCSHTYTHFLLLQSRQRGVGLRRHSTHTMLAQLRLLWVRHLWF